MARAAAVLRVSPEETPERVEALVKELKQAKKLSAAGGKSAAGGVDQLLAAATKLGDTTVVIAETAGGAQVLRQLIDQLRRKASPIAVMLAAKQEEGKVMLAAGLSRDLVERGLDAVAWVRGAGELVGGSGGGGRPDMAQAGGKNADKLPEALKRTGPTSRNCWANNRIAAKAHHGDTEEAGKKLPWGIAAHGTFERWNPPSRLVQCLRFNDAPSVMTIFKEFR